ncbi:MAG TPA: hypothetical protein ENI73_05370 [Spirochaetes bacterium]|nr:hypothetical protein [Spirochaetota bacterium]
MMKDEGFKRRWDHSGPCRNIIKHIIRIQIKYNISARDLEDLYGIGEDQFYEIEKGNEELGRELLDKMKVVLGENVETKAL